ncbi:STT3 domain-containing protein [Fundidesulfovibrio agrisoli]|uniref:STT3 domain-containing protein n=1 Tax=Fundidesulfovibrio agrisoli TaxID=2922717 RepID=UPI001FAE4A7B|nr:STT3 domain-containing protein [Fundidesulfovibrio agrisoli]
MSLTAGRRALPAVAAILLGLAARFSEFQAWDSPWLSWEGLPLLPSFDAYGWLAGAACVGRLAGEPLSMLLAALHRLTGLPLEVLGFWLPALLAPLAAWPVARLCSLAQVPEAALTAGAATVLAPAYLYRTRLGFCDTDMLVLPLLCGCAWALGSWAARLGDDSGKGSNAPALTRAVAAGALLALTCAAYPSGRVVAAGMAVCALAAASCLGVRSLRSVLPGAGLFAVAVGLGFWPFAFAAVLLGAWVRLPATLRPRGRLRAALLLLAGCALAAVLAYSLPSIWEKLRAMLFFFAKLPGQTTMPGQTPLPGASPSLLEAQTPDLPETLRQAGFHWILAAAAAPGYLWALFRAPVLLPTLPLALLAASSPWLGVRFAMYGGPALGLGLAAGGALLAGAMRLGSWAGRGMQAALLAVLAVLAARDAATLVPLPVLSPRHAQALSHLRTMVHHEAQVWTWWDYGYAAQHLAGLRTFADPGNNGGEVLYLQSMALAAPDDAKAARAMLLAARTQASGPPPAPCPRWCAPFGLACVPPNPDAFFPLAGKDLAATRAVLASLDAPLPPGPLGANLPEQYLVVSWEALRTARWPLAFAAWDPQAPQPGAGPFPFLALKPKSIDLDNGVIELEEGVFPLDGILIRNASGKGASRHWNRPGAAFAALNLGNQELIVMDERSRESAAARLLLDDPPGAESPFELVDDGAPWVRVYRLRAQLGETVDIPSGPSEHAP